MLQPQDLADDAVCIHAYMQSTSCTGSLALANAAVAFQLAAESHQVRWMADRLTELPTRLLSRSAAVQVLLSTPSVAAMFRLQGLDSFTHTRRRTLAALLQVHTAAAASCAVKAAAGWLC